jgi:anti-anti-sigma regulatory factor
MARIARKEPDVGVTLEKSETLNLLRLEGAIDIASAVELKDLLLKALEPPSEVRVSLEGATDLDVTAVQLLWAAERKAKGAGVAFSYVGAMQEAVFTSLGEAGLHQFIVPVSV